MNKPTFKELYYLCVQKLTNFPYIEEDFDALTNYELLCKVVEELNKMITNMNTQNESILALYDAFNTLKNYIDNYFENLDVQEEINNKLDEMTRTGELTEIIKSYVDPIFEEYENEVDVVIDDFKNDVNENINAIGNYVQTNISLQNQKLTNLSSGTPIPASSTSGMTDTTKLYVNTTDGYVYYYNGSQWVQGWIYQATSNQDEIDDLILSSGNYVYELTHNNTNTSLRIDISDTFTQDEKLYFKMIEKVIANSGSTEVYGFTDSSTNERIGLFSNTDFDMHILTCLHNYIKIRVVIQYTDTDTSTISAKCILGHSNNHSITALMTSYDDYLKTIEGRVLNAKEKTTVQNSNINTLLGTTDLNDLKEMNVYYFYQLTGLSHAPLSTMTGLFYTICYDNRTSGFIQFFLDASTNNLYYRSSTGSQANPVYSNWEIISTNKETDVKNRLNNLTCKIFRKVLCVGDSYTSGYIVDSSSVAHENNPDYAFPHYLETMTGNTYVNCGVSGASTKSWLTNANGLAKAQANGRCQAYIVGLMINDSSDRGSHVDVGVSTDIGTNNDTYYAYYSKIIRELNAISPLAKIFIETCPKNDHERYDDYNQAVRDIYNAYKNTYPVYLLDLEENIELFTNDSLTDDLLSGHYTALGYEQFAEILAYLISDYINNHVTDFQDVAFIPYD